MDIKKALFITQEISPYLSGNATADLNRRLSQDILESGVEVRTFMPKYGLINERRNQLHEVIRLSGLNIVIDDNDHPLVIKVATMQPSRMQVYFIDNEDYFGINDHTDIELYTRPGDNDERIMFFVRGVIETVKKLRWVPELVLCTGWVTALMPLYMRIMYADDPTVRDTKIVYALQGRSFDGALDERFVEKLKMDGFSDEVLELIGSAPMDYSRLVRTAIDHADAVVQTEADIDEDLLQYAIDSGKPFLPYPGDDEEGKNAYLDFYGKL